MEANYNQQRNDQQQLKNTNGLPLMGPSLFSKLPNTIFTLRYITKRHLKKFKNHALKINPSQIAH